MMDKAQAIVVNYRCLKCGKFIIKGATHCGRCLSDKALQGLNAWIER